MSKLKKAATAISAAGVLLVAGFEGFSEFAYQPVAGDKWTIGFGHTGDVREGERISLQEALGLLSKDLLYASEAVNKYVSVPLLQCQFDALVSLVYNIGPEAFRTSSLLKALNRMDYEEVSRQWMRWKYFKGKPLKGLEVRRARELAVFNGEPVVKSGSSVCFGGGVCVPYNVLVQEAGGRPDGAQAS